MYSKTIFAAVAAMLASAALAQNGVTCQTSSASPSTGDVTDVINQLKGRGGTCGQTNGHASDCTTLVKHNSAAIAICGTVTDNSPSCDTVAGYANQIQQDCMSGGKAGGTYTINAGQRVEVIHS